MAIFCNFQTTSNHLHPIQVENCDSNSRLVVDEDDNGKFRLERVERYYHDFYLFYDCGFFVLQKVLSRLTCTSRGMRITHEAMSGG